MRLVGLWKFILMGLILVGAWLGFLYLAGNPPFDPIPALIMVWASVVALTFVGFPKFWGQIKRLKIKDFEIELQQSVAAASAKEGFEIPVQADLIIGEKGNLLKAKALIKKAMLSPGKPVVLIVNAEFESVVINKLILLLQAFEIIEHPVITLFIKGRQQELDIRSLKQEQIIGAISRAQAIIVLSSFLDHNDNRFRGRIMSAYTHKDISFLWDIWREMDETGEDRSIGNCPMITAEFIRAYFGNLLSTRFVDHESVLERPDDLQNAIRNNHEYILVLKDLSLESIIQIELLTKEIALQTLAQLSKNK